MRKLLYLYKIYLLIIVQEMMYLKTYGINLLLA